MQLFKRVLLSLFPDEIVAQTMNPASMFISFISTREFFSVINRKIVENYKLNLFDITLDPFEFKIWFGENPPKSKDIDTYYSYCSTANLNGYRFFSPANISNNLALVVALYVKDIFRAYPPDYYLNFLYTVFLLSFVFLSRIKIFPYTDREKNYNRFVETMFAFYEFVFQQTGKKIDPNIIKSLKKELLNQIELFFLLFAVYQNLNSIFVHEQVSDKELYSWLFYDELKGESKSIYAEFIANHKEYTNKKTFSAVETKIMQSILPADILLRYLFIDADMFLITDTVISKIFDKKILDDFIKSFRKDDTQLENFLLYITDYRNFKKNFFWGIQKYMMTIFRDEDNKVNPTKEDLDDLMSSIGEDVENIESFKIPERIKKESKMMEKILNFYITLIWWSWVSRGDNFFLRLFRKPIIQGISKINDQFDEKNYTLLYYGWLLYQYGKNVFFYKHTSENVRAWKQKFTLPHKTNIKNIYSNISLLKSFDETFIATILQDINPKDIRLYIKNKKIIELFKWLIGQEISSMVRESDTDFIESVYKDIAVHLEHKEFMKILKKELTEQDIYHIKENIYNLDFWISKKFFRAITAHTILLKKDYADLTILGIFSTIRETFSGFLIYLTYLKDEMQTKEIQLDTSLLISLYIKDILNMDPYYEHKITDIITTLQADFNEIIKHRIEIDDNKDYLKIGYDNRITFTKNKDIEETKKKIINEDVIRFKWFLKNISYYNKRFLMPQ